MLILKETDQLNNTKIGGMASLKEMILHASIAIKEVQN